jgi:alpha-L-fucosidase
VVAILDNRVAKGFTAVQVMATRGWSKTDHAGNFPFIDDNPTQLNAAYWQRWRWICDEAATRNLYFFLVMGEPGRTGDKNVPWKVQDNGQAYEYSRQVGTFFASAPNVIFAQGQDSQANGGIMPGHSTCLDANGWRAMAEGTADGVNGVNDFNNSADYTSTLMTYHGLEKYPVSYTDDISYFFQNDAWIDFYGPEVWHDNDYIYEIVNRDYNLGKPVKPSFIMEGTYETAPFRGKLSPTLPYYLRLEAWHSLLGGICGYAYGHHNNWNQSGNLTYLNAPGAEQMSHLAGFAKKYQWWKWVPDSTLITNNSGSGAARKVGVNSVDGSKCVVYFPTNSNATIRNILKSKTTATWFDPRNGNTSSVGTFNSGESRNITPPTGWEDALLVLVAIPSPTFSQEPNYLKEYKKEYSKNPREANLHWFTDARFGMFIHYGLYSQLGKGEWVQLFDTIPLDEYAQLKEKFTASSFDAGFIAKLAKKAGMKYITMTSKHHEGFCLFKTKETDFNSVNSPAHRDLIGEMAKACEKEGLGLFLYYSYAADWKHPYFYSRNEGWKSARPAYKAKPEEYKYDKPEDFRKYIDYVHAQLTELLTQYPTVAGIWFDPVMGFYANPGVFPIDETYALIRKLSPHALISFKQGANGDEDFMAPERGGNVKVGEKYPTAKKAYELNKDKPKEVCNTMQPPLPGINSGSTWGYNKAINGHHLKVADVKKLLKEAEKDNHNLLLNIGPLPDGSVHPEDIETLSNLKY